MIAREGQTTSHVLCTPKVAYSHATHLSHGHRQLKLPNPTLTLTLTPPVPWPQETEVAEVVGQPLRQAAPQLGVHVVQPGEALAHAGAHGASEGGDQLQASAGQRKSAAVGQRRSAQRKWALGPGLQWDQRE